MTGNKIWKKSVCAAVVFAMAGMLCGCGEPGEKTASATLLIQSLDYQGALEELTAAREAGEDERLIDRSAGIAYMGLTEYGQAVEAFLACLAGSNGLIGNLDFDTNYYLAAAYTKNGQFAEAEDTYDAILDLRPGEADAYFLRGNVRMSLDNYTGAKEDFDKVISMEPRNYDRLIKIYEVLAHFGYREAGQEYLRTALASGDRQMDNYVVGRIYFYLEDYQKACMALEEAKEKGSELSLYVHVLPSLLLSTTKHSCSNSAKVGAMKNGKGRASPLVARTVSPMAELKDFRPSAIIYAVYVIV